VCWNNTARKLRCRNAYRTTILKFQSTKIELLAEVLGNGYRLLLRKVEKKGNRVNGWCLGLCVKGVEGKEETEVRGDVNRLWVEGGGLTRRKSVGGVIVCACWSFFSSAFFHD
jgi:hypothetical protein